MGTLARVWLSCPCVLLVSCLCYLLRNQHLHKLSLQLSFGASFISFYRLVGPFRSSTAPEVIKTEIWETIARRGFIGNIVMGWLPMIFYLALNAIVYVVAATGEYFRMA